MPILLPVPQILQNPELPNGCEITSCCQVLRYWGFDADKCDLADHYLPRSEVWYGADPDKVYMGNPHIDAPRPDCGYYCFAGPVVFAANHYMAANGGGFAALDITGSGEADLVSQLRKRRPVIFWASLHFEDIQYDPCGSYPLPGGGSHRVFHQLHCMVLKGMDDTNFFIADPLGFNTAVPRAQFMEIYRQLGSRAVVILPLGEPLSGLL
ncbi:MAG: C39 family peptidase [Gemmiger sp.]|nr:C39 family peptidase [Gemmiger sp.]